MQLENLWLRWCHHFVDSLHRRLHQPLWHPAGNDALAYPATSQEQAAVNFIVAHPGKVALITISIGGNDFTSCAVAADPVACITTAVAGINTNVTALVDDSTRWPHRTTRLQR